MPADDALFEKALARQLRNESSANPEAISRNAEREQQQVCPDAEVLAAYHERLLSNEEMNLWKGHIFSCARCQEILAQLEGTDEVVVADSEKDQIAAVYGEAGGPAAMLPQVTQGFEGTREVTTAAQVARRRRFVSYWIVPAGAIAAVLLVWIGAHRQSKTTLSQPAVQTAENQQVPPPRAEPPALDSTNSDNKVAAEPKNGRKNSQAADETRALTRKKFSAEEPAVVRPNEASRSSGVVPGAFDGKSIGTSIGGSAGTSTGARSKRADDAARVPPAPATESVEVNGEAATVPQAQSSPADLPPLPTGQQLQMMQLSPAAPAAKSAREKEAQTRSTAAADALISEQAESVTVNQPARLRAVAQERDARMIPAPGGNIMWRVGKSGLIEQSTNSGALWTRQSSGVSVTLDSGSAPSAAVCWVIGRAGTILLTVDGGGHWTKIISPIAGDVGGVLAVDAQHATIWDVTKKNNFVTVDGGASWVRVANP